MHWRAKLKNGCIRRQIFLAANAFKKKLMPPRDGMGFFCMNCLPGRVTGKILLPTINGEAAARGGRVFILH
jgi:hypothetical protein